MYRRRRKKKKKKPQREQAHLLTNRRFSSYVSNRIFVISPAHLTRPKFLFLGGEPLSTQSESDRAMHAKIKTESGVSFLSIYLFRSDVSHPFFTPGSAACLINTFHSGVK